MSTWTMAIEFIIRHLSVLLQFQRTSLHRNTELRLLHITVDIITYTVILYYVTPIMEHSFVFQSISFFKELCIQ